MPHIRKKTSNRKNTRDRAKVTKKVSESNKKKKRNDKRNPTWKSKRKADPGVPNSFHLKDQVLAELAEEKRRNEEAKQARREASKKEEEEEDTPGIASLASSIVLSASAPIASSSKKAQAADDDIPELVDTELATLQDVLEKADVVLQVVDARDIQGGRSAFIENLLKETEGRHALIVNKIDLVPRETLSAWLPHLPTNTFLFSSQIPSSAGPSSLGRIELTRAFKEWSKGGELTVALMGLPNVGKTAILNSFLPASTRRHALAPVLPTTRSAKHPQPTTKKPVEVALSIEGIKLRVIDTPGWDPIEEDDDEEEEDEEEDDEAEATAEEEKDWDALEARLAGDLLRRNLGRIDRVKDIFPLVNYIVKRSNAQDLMLAYNIPFFESGNVDAFLLSLARAKGQVRKHGDANLEAAARILVRDWATGQFPYYTPAPTTKLDVEIAGGRPDLSKVLDGCKTRKEMRATGRGLVKFQGGEVDPREVILDDDYIAINDVDSDDDEFETDEAALLGLEDEEDDEEEDEEVEEVEGSDEEENEALILGAEDGEEVELEDGPEPSSGSELAEEEGESEEEEPVPQAAPKRKRRSDVSVAAPVKKAKRVSFGKNETRTIAGRGGNKRKR